MSLDSFDRFFSFVTLNLLPVFKIVMRVVASVHDIIFDRMQMLSQSLNVMRPYKPLASILLRYSLLDIFGIVVYRQIHRMRRSDSVINKVI